MKKLFTTVLTICATSALFAQTIPNAGFENWTLKNSKFYDPDGWGTLNSSTSPANVITCNKGTASPAAGSSYLMLTSKALSGQTLAAIAASGSFNALTGEFGGGFAMDQMPSKLTGKWQYMASGADQGAVLVLLTKQNAISGEKDTIGIGAKLLTGMAMSWTDFSIDISYSTSLPPGSEPDSCLILFTASGSNPVAGSYLYVDALSFNGATNVNEISNIQSYNVFPNPAKDKLNVECNLKASSLVNISISDIQGKQVNTSESMMNKGDNKISLDVSNLNKGIYFVQIQTEGSSVTKKVIVE